VVESSVRVPDFSFSAKGIGLPVPVAEPTSMQVVADVQDTALNCADVAPGGTTREVTDHAPPARVSTTGSFGIVDPEAVALPTATHDVVEVQETPLSPALVTPTGFAWRSWNHWVPFQDSMSASLAAVASSCHDPTATQWLLVGHDTPCRVALVELTGGGTSRDHDVPFQVSARAKVAPLADSE
jgi:hypothetical protein